MKITIPALSFIIITLTGCMNARQSAVFVFKPTQGVELIEVYDNGDHKGHKLEDGSIELRTTIVSDRDHCAWIKVKTNNKITQIIAPLGVNGEHDQFSGNVYKAHVMVFDKYAEPVKRVPTE